MGAMVREAWNLLLIRFTPALYPDLVAFDELNAWAVLINELPRGPSQGISVELIVFLRAIGLIQYIVGAVNEGRVADDEALKWALTFGTGQGAVKRAVGWTAKTLRDSSRVCPAPCPPIVRTF